MIREALQYVAGLVTDSQEIITKEINGETYIKTVYGMGYMWIGGLKKGMVFLLTEPVE